MKDLGAARPLGVQAILIGAMAIWGLNVAAVKELTEVFEPVVLAAIRMLVACGTLTIIVCARRSGIRGIGMKQIGALTACAVLMVYINQILFAEGLSRSTATNGALIMALSPLVSALMGALAFKERLTSYRILGVAIGFAGVAAVVLSHPGAGLSAAGKGDLMLVSAVVSFAGGGAVVQRLARRIDPLTISWVIYLIGSVMLTAHALISDGASINIQLLGVGWWPWTLVLFSAVMATALSNLVWNNAIARIGVAQTAVFLYWVPIFGVAFAALFLGEQLTLWHLGGFCAVMGGTYLGTRKAPVQPAI